MEPGIGGTVEQTAESVQAVRGLVPSHRQALPRRVSPTTIYQTFGATA